MSLGVKNSLGQTLRRLPLVFLYKKLPNYFQVVYQFAFPAAMSDSSCFSILLPALDTVSLISAIIIDSQWYLIIVLICISLTTNVVEYFFFYILACHPHIFLVKCLFRFFAHFLWNHMFYCYWILSLYIFNMSYSSYVICKYLPSVCGLMFQSFSSIFQRTNFKI